MNRMDARLVELNELLLKMSTGYRPPKEVIDQAQQVVSGASIKVDTGVGNDTVVINENGEDCKCPPGPQGPTGPQGEIGRAHV